jgi:hypothetical protein
MFNFLLQSWGGSFYLLNKLFFSKAERAVDPQRQQKWRIMAWTSYLIGLPPWILIFISERNWIAAAVESSGVPAMVFGLTAALRGYDRFQKFVWLDYLAKLMTAGGLSMSLYQFGGLVILNQFLELGIATGFLLGTYFLAKTRPRGYFWLGVGNISAAALMMRQGYFLLMFQQIISLGLVLDAYRSQSSQFRSVIISREVNSPTSARPSTGMKRSALLEKRHLTEAGKSSSAR